MQQLFSYCRVRKATVKVHSNGSLPTAGNTKLLDLQFHKLLAKTPKKSNLNSYRFRKSLLLY